MAGMTQYLPPRDPNSDDPAVRYRGFITLPKNLPREDEARNREMARDAEEWNRKCQEALDFAAARSGTAGLPFDENSKIALQALGTGYPQAFRITDAGMKIADDFLARNPNLFEEAKAVPGGTVGKVNFGAQALSLGYGERINGPRPDPLGALLGNATVMRDRDGKTVGISDQFDYNPNPKNDWLTATGMRIVNDRITENCRDRVPYVPIMGGRAIPSTKE